MNVPFPDRLLPSSLSVLSAQLALTDRSSRVSVCSSSPQYPTLIMEMKGLCTGDSNEIVSHTRVNEAVLQKNDCG